MGEAKRRKQILGSDYGKKFPRLKIVSAAFHRHLEKFCQAWQEYLSQQEFTLQYFSSHPKTLPLQKEKWKAWLQNYLQSYQPEDHQKLLAAFMFYWYKDMTKAMSLNESDPGLVHFSMELVFMSLNFYQLARSYFSEDVASEFVLPLQSFYEEVFKDDVAESMRDEEMAQEAKYLKELLEEALEID